MENVIREYTTRKGKTVIYKEINRIESPDDAYIIGNLAFDGTYQSRSHYMWLETTDLMFLQLVKEVWNPTLEVNSRGKRSSKLVNSVNECYRAYLPMPLVKDLRKFGIVGLKPERTLVNIPKWARKYALLGALDAEGWWTIRHRKDCRTDRLNFGLRSSAGKCTEILASWLEEEGFASKLYYNRKNMTEIRIETVKTAIKLGHWLYLDLPKYCSQKKMRVFMNYVNTATESGELRETYSAIRSQAKLYLNNQAKIVCLEGSETK